MRKKNNGDANMNSSKNINKNLNSFANKFKYKRKLNSKLLSSYPEIEFECKIPTSPSNLAAITRLILEKIRDFKIVLDSVASRREFHHFYGDEKNMGAFIFLQGSREVWIKKKRGANIIYSPQHKIPILMRGERKLKPRDSLYNKLFKEILKLDYIGSFQKDCVDVSFWLENALFTVTVAQSVTNQSNFSQIEIEYDGHRINSNLPSKKNLLILFDEVISLLLPKSEMNFSTKTKLEWLKSHQK